MPTRTQVLYWVMWPGIAHDDGRRADRARLRWRMLAGRSAGLRAARTSGEEFPLNWVIGGSLVLAVGALRDPEAVLRPAGLDDAVAILLSCR